MSSDSTDILPIDGISPPAATKKAPREPLPPIADLITRCFLQPFGRRYKFLYVGLPLPRGTYAVGTIDDAYSKLASFDPMALIGYVTLLHDTDIDAMEVWLDSLDIPRDGIYGVVGLTDIATVLSSVRWDISKCTITPRPTLNARIITNTATLADSGIGRRLLYREPMIRFVLDDIYEHVSALTIAMSDDTPPKHYLDVTLRSGHVEQQLGWHRVSVTPDMYGDSSLAEVTLGRAFHFPVFKGADWFILPKAKTAQPPSILRIWHVDGNHFAYATRLVTDRYIAVGSRVYASSLFVS